MPFCGHKCAYCDFYSVVDPGRHGPFVAALSAELRCRAEQVAPAPRTLFVGGGTPTLLAPALWRRLLGQFQRLGLVRALDEFTVEANPETVTVELVEVLVAGGVNRLSLGAQSAQRQLLATLDRRHGPETVARAVAVARRAGIDNISLDYIFALPGQTPAMLEADIDAAVALAPQHLSFYELTCEPGTELARRQLRPVPPQLQRRMYERVMHRLDAAGYEHYEISNWALRAAPDPCHGPAGSADHRCRHNLIYWQNENWLGLGPAAASHVDGFRWKNQPDLARYLQQPGHPPTADHEQLPEPQRIGEHLMLGLRLRQGVPLGWLAQRLPEDDPRQGAIQELTDLGMLERTDTHLRLTRNGLFVADTVIAKLL